MKQPKKTEENSPNFFGDCGDFCIFATINLIGYGYTKRVILRRKKIFEGIWN